MGLGALALLFVGIGIAASFMRSNLVPVESSTPLLEQEVASASLIARVRIQNREPIPQSIEGPPCWYQYSAAVTEALKGEQNHITFFAATDRLESGHEYLVFLHKLTPNDAHAAKRLRDLQPTSESEMLACRITDAAFYLPVGRQTYFAFDSVAEHRFGGEWLKLHDEGQVAGFTWCFGNWPSNVRVPRRNILVTKEMEPGYTGSQVVTWSSAKKDILEALDNPPDWWGGIPNPLFQPGAC